MVSDWTLGGNLNGIPVSQTCKQTFLCVLSKWEVKRCQCCGSSGTHVACSSLQLLEQNWECLDCRRISYGAGKILSFWVKLLLFKCMLLKTFACVSVKLTSGFKYVDFRKAPKHPLVNSTNVTVTDCLLEEPSSKLPRQSAGTHHKELQRYAF